MVPYWGKLATPIYPCWPCHSSDWMPHLTKSSVAAFSKLPHFQGKTPWSILLQGFMGKSLHLGVPNIIFLLTLGCANNNRIKWQITVTVSDWIHCIFTINTILWIMKIYLNPRHHKQDRQQVASSLWLCQAGFNFFLSKYCIFRHKHCTVNYVNIQHNHRGIGEVMTKIELGL